MPFNLNPEVVMGVVLIGFGLFTFSKGTSQSMSQGEYLRSAHNVSNLVNTAKSVHNISNTLKKTSNVLKETSNNEE
jgi:hypothetical protein